MSDAHPASVPSQPPAPPFEVHVEPSPSPANGGASPRVHITIGAGGFTRRGQEIIPPCATLAELEERAHAFLAAFEAAYQSARARLAAGGTSPAAGPGTP